MRSFSIVRPSIPLFFLILLVFSAPLQGQSPAEKPQPCADSVYRQMDFWLGDWDVFSPKGLLQGTNRIDLILGSCVLFENWVGAGGSRGHSFNIYNRKEKRWEQTWVDDSGEVIYFRGNWDEKVGQMVYFSETKTKVGKPLLYRMIFTPQAGEVQQVWEASFNSGQDWMMIFEGIYRKKK